MLAQNTFSGQVSDFDNNLNLSDVEIYNYDGDFITKTNSSGRFSFLNNATDIKLVFYLIDYDYRVITLSANEKSNIYLKPYTIDLKEVIIIDKQNNFSNTKLDDVVGNSIFAGKKTNNIILENMKKMS